MLPASHYVLAGRVHPKPGASFERGGAIGFASATCPRIPKQWQWLTTILSETWIRKRRDRFSEVPFGARSAAGSMTALSRTLNVREHGFQMYHYRGCAGDPLKS